MRAVSKESEQYWQQTIGNNESQAAKRAAVLGDEGSAEDVDKQGGEVWTP